MKKGAAKVLTAVLTTSMVAGTLGFGSVYADDNTTGLVIDPQALAESVNENLFDYTEEQETLQETYPTKYDLRNVDGVSYVTNVKFQNPWGTCWAFAYTAAAEISILGETGGSKGENADIDLSEHHLSWFAKNHIDNEENSQNGEGMYITVESTSTSSMEGGLSYYATIPYASGMGVVSESGDVSFEYHGTGKKVVSTDHNTYDSVEACIAAGKTPYYYSNDDDWSINESFRFAQSYKLEESYMLPEVAPVLNDDKTLTINTDGINAVKEMLMAKRGVAIAYCSDNSQPGQSANLATARFVNSNWAHYTWTDDEDDYAYANHEVCIVGWDDSYSAENFTITNPVKWDEYQNLLYKLNPDLNICSDDDGKTYYYQNNDNEKVVIDKSLYGSIEEDEEVDDLYHFKDNVELENDSSGNTFYLDTTKYIEDANKEYLCTVAHTMGTFTPEGDGAWIVKNSWGSLKNSDGTDSTFPNRVPGGVDNTGYFYISYWDRSVTNPEAFDFVTDADADEAEYDYTYVEQYDYLPTSSVLDMGVMMEAAAPGSQVSMANAFGTDATVELTATSCVTTRPNTTVKYELYVGEMTESSKPLETITATYEYGGYHRAEFEKSVVIPGGTKYYIVVTQTYESSGKTGYAAPLAYAGGKGDNAKNYTVGVINEGESYLIVNGEWTDMSTQVGELAAAFKQQGMAVDAQFDNFSIKAYSNPVDTMYRLYNPNSGEHLFTSNTEEVENLTVLGWSDEGIAWYAPEKSSTPVYRLYNPNNGDHHYTTNEEEKEWLVSLGWNDEGIAWYSGGDVSVYRLFNPNATTATHHYTAFTDEQSWLISLGWQNEDIAWKALAITK